MFENLFSERGLSLDRLKALIEVHDSGSIAGAAPGDAAKQSQISRQLRELSGFFGCELAERRGKVLKLSEGGTYLSQLARNFLHGLEDFRDQCRGERLVFNIAAGDSLVQWLVIPRIGKLVNSVAGGRFATCSLRTNEIVQHLADCRLDFGLIRKNAVAPGLKSFPLGTLSYVAVIPTALARSKKALSLTSILRDYPIATQTTDGEFTKKLRALAVDEGLAFRPALSCQSFPQTIAAVRSGKFAAIVPEIAVSELPAGSVTKVPIESLKQLERSIVLAWNPRLLKVRPDAAHALTDLQTALRFG